MSQETPDMVDAFTDELSFELVEEFRSMASHLNGDGPPTGRQLGDCALKCAFHIQREGREFLYDWDFETIVRPLIERREYGESLRPFYDASILIS